MAPGTRFGCPGRRIFSFFMISGVFWRGLNIFEETTSGKKLPKVALFCPHLRLKPCFGIPLDVIWHSIYVKFVTLRTHILCNKSPAKARFSLLNVSGFCINCSSDFSLWPKTLFGWLSFHYIYICLVKLVYLERRFGPRGSPKSIMMHPFSPKVVFFCPPVWWVMVKDVFFSQPVRWVTVSSTHRE